MFTTPLPPKYPRIRVERGIEGSERNDQSEWSEGWWECERVGVDGASDDHKNYDIRWRNVVIQKLVTCLQKLL